MSPGVLHCDRLASSVTAWVKGGQVYYTGGEERPGVLNCR